MYYRGWMNELDRWYKKKLERNNSSTPSKERKQGSPAASLPPSNGPEWAIDKSWTPSNGNLLLQYNVESL